MRRDIEYQSLSAEPTKKVHTLKYFIVAAVVLTIFAILSLTFGSQTTLILISIDGARPDYLNRQITPTLSKLVKSGIFYEMVPSFPSITFPNHYTLVTGLYPTYHGIVANQFYDPIFNTTFNYRSRNDSIDPKWWVAEPLWITAKKQALQTSTFYWPGSECPHNGIMPDNWKRYNDSTTPEEKVETVVEWIEQGSEFEADHAGHEFGPDSEQVNTALQTIDNAISSLIMLLDSRYVNYDLVIVSDHGMSNTNPDKIIILDELVDLSSSKVFNFGPMAFINNDPNDKIYNALKEVSLERKYFKVWKRAEIPSQYHYSSTRVGDILVLAEINYSILVSKNDWMGKGTHGYLPETQDMTAIFIANGKRAKKISSKLYSRFSNIEIYGYLSAILGIEALPHNGTINW